MEKTKNKKKFKDTRVGKFLTKAAPNILKGVSEIVPDAGILKLVGGLMWDAWGGASGVNWAINKLKQIDKK